MQNTVITSYDNCHENKARSYPTIETALESIRTENRFSARVEELRTLRHDKEAYSNYKETQIPAFTFSGVFRSINPSVPDRRRASLDHHTGLITLDIEDVEDVRLLKDRLADEKALVAAFTSPGGEGVKAIYRVDPIPQSPREHRDAYLTVAQRVVEAHGVKLDHTPDVTRLCVMSYDPDIYINYDAEGIPWEPSPLPERPQTQSVSDESLRIRSALRYISPDLEYDQWIKVLMAIHNAEQNGSVPPGEGIYIADDWSSPGEKYDSFEDIENHWNSFESEIDDGVTPGTIYWTAKKHGWDGSALGNTFLGIGVDNQKATVLVQEDSDELIDIEDPDIKDIPKHIADIMLETQNFAALETDEKEVFKWYDRGVWEPIGSAESLGYTAARWMDETNTGFNPTERLRRAIPNALYGALHVNRVYIEDAKIGVLPLANGQCVDLDADTRTYDIRPLRREDYIRELGKFNLPDDPKEPERMNQFIKECADYDKDLERYLWEVLAKITFLPNDEGEVFALYGLEGSGKGVLMTMMIQLLGKRALSIDSNYLNNFSFADVPQRSPSVLLFDEISVEQREFDTLVRKLAQLRDGSVPIQIQKKHSNTMDYTYRGHLVMAANEFPAIQHLGFMRSLLMIPFSNSAYRNGTVDTKLKQKLEEEVPDILWKLMNIATKPFGNIPKRVTDVTNDLNEDDSFTAWRKHSIDIDLDAKVTFAELYEHYCLIAGPNPVRELTFRRRFNSEQYPRHSEKGPHGVIYYKLKLASTDDIVNKQPAF